LRDAASAARVDRFMMVLQMAYHCEVAFQNFLSVARNRS
jgi:hypothetical protein